MRGFGKQSRSRAETQTKPHLDVQNLKDRDNAEAAREEGRGGIVRSRGVERDAPHGVGPLVGQLLSNADDGARLARVPPRGACPGEWTLCIVHGHMCTAALVTEAGGWEPLSIPQQRSTRTAAPPFGREGKEGSTNTGREVEEP